MSLHVLRPGTQSLLVDFGRPRSRSLGVPVGGAADRAALALGNALVGNPPDAAALEICLTGPILRADQPTACVVFGAPFAVSTDQRRLTANYTFTLRPDEELHIDGTRRGMRAYLCVVGGFEVPLMLGSRSALRHSRRGDSLACQPSILPGRWLAVNFAVAGADHLDSLWYQRPQPLRIVPGPQADWFGDRGRFLGTVVEPCLATVSPDSDRMGLRLQGEPFSVPPRNSSPKPFVPAPCR